MPEEQIKTTLSELRDTLEHADTVDPELRELLLQVDADIQKLLASPTRDAAHAETLNERIEELSAGFAAKHPHTESFFQELIAALGRLGI
jgi:hypothetical protein